MRACVGARGIIPARAGFTHPGGRTATPPADHPRSRGVYMLTVLLLTHAVGSSPLARGLPPTLPFHTLTRGIIPARAGFTRRRHRRYCEGRDHPRSRGVYSTQREELTRRLGSSPLARGLPTARPWRTCASGIIPARAGFTITTLCSTLIPWDHPRSRGVYAEFWDCPQIEVGSSPLARGLPSPLLCAPHHARIIPARAGFTRERPPPAQVPADHPRSRGVYP